MSDFQEFCDWLKSKDWNPGELSNNDSFNWMWYKGLSEIQPRCRLNEKPLQIVIYGYEFPGLAPLSFQISIVAESHCGSESGSWVDLKFYSLTLAEMHNLDCYIERLVRAWQSINSIRENI